MYVLPCYCSLTRSTCRVFGHSASQHVVAQSSRPCPSSAPPLRPVSVWSEPAPLQRLLSTGRRRPHGGRGLSRTALGAAAGDLTAERHGAAAGELHETDQGSNQEPPRDVPPPPPSGWSKAFSSTNEAPRGGWVPPPSHRGGDSVDQSADGRVFHLPGTLSDGSGPEPWSHDGGSGVWVRVRALRARGHRLLL